MRLKFDRLIIVFIAFINHHHFYQSSGDCLNLFGVISPTHLILDPPTPWEAWTDKREYKVCHKQKLSSTGWGLLLLKKFIVRVHNVGSFSGCEVEIVTDQNHLHSSPSHHQCHHIILKLLCSAWSLSSFNIAIFISITIVITKVSIATIIIIMFWSSSLFVIEIFVELLCWAWSLSHRRGSGHRASLL